MFLVFVKMISYDNGFLFIFLKTDNLSFRRNYWVHYICASFTG